MRVCHSNLAHMIVKPSDFDPFTRQWSRTRLDWMMAVFIAMTAGYLDGYGLLFLKTYVSFMSGNTNQYWRELRPG
jgi:hypothetical protein